MLDFDNLLQLENAMQPVIDKIKSYDNVVLYGLGTELKGHIKHCIGWLGKPAFIVDKSAGGTVYNGIPVVSSLADICERIEGTFCVVITAPTYREEIFIECKKYVPEDAIFKHLIPLSQNSPTYKNFVKVNKEMIESFYLSLSDDFSKITLKNYLSGKISNDLRYFIKICVPNKVMNPAQLHSTEINYPSLFDSEQTPYFPKDIFTLPKNVVFTDCGAFDGDTLTDFVNETNGEYATVICIELNPSSYKDLTETAKKYQNVQCVHAGVWNEDTVTEIKSNASANGSFSIDASKSESANINSTCVPLKKLDTIFAEHGLVENIYIYIKMDVEGAELMALKGAKHTIKAYKPKLAICVYHKDEDIIEIPTYLKSLRPDYSFYLRKYTINATELVLFAI